MFSGQAFTRGGALGATAQHWVLAARDIGPVASVEKERYRLRGWIQRLSNGIVLHESFYGEHHGRILVARAESMIVVLPNCVQNNE